jgi:hypothetical protein
MMIRPRHAGYAMDAPMGYAGVLINTDPGSGLDLTILHEMQNLLVAAITP